MSKAIDYIEKTYPETAKEFQPSDFIWEPEPQSILEHIERLDKEYSVKRKLAFKFGKKYKEKFNKSSIAENILNIIKWFMFL